MIDLHTHSTFSDGTFTPDQLIAYAKEKNITAIALTDHDTVAGLPQALSAANKAGIIFISGTELSCIYEGKEVHILGLGINPNSPTLLNHLQNLAQTRIKRNETMMQAFNDANIPMNISLLKETAEGQIITRAHFAKYLVKIGYSSNIKVAFEKYLSPGRRFYFKREECSSKNVISFIHEGGGLAVLAHATLYKMKYPQIEKMLIQLKSEGLNGLECYHSAFSNEDTAYMLTFAKRYNFKISGGSDFHGANKPSLDLGVGYGNLHVPDKILSGLFSYSQLT